MRLRPRLPRRTTLTLALVLLGMLAACGAPAADSANSAAAPTSGAATTEPAAPTSGAATTEPAADQADAPEKPLNVVASTDVWGDIAAQIGGDRVQVTSLIYDLSQDPHSFQPTGRDELAVSRADIVIVNGGGYDDFLVRMLQSVGPHATVITATEAAADVPSVDPENEHIWLDLDATRTVADAIADAMSKRDSQGATEFRDNAEAFEKSLDPVARTLADVKSSFAGTPVAMTEPLPGYLFAAAGLDDITPDSFTEAMEEGIDVSPADLADVLGLFTDHRVKLLVYNEQSASNQAEQVLGAARDSGVPVLGITELLPEGEHFAQWVGHIAADMQRLLAGEGS